MSRQTILELLRLSLTVTFCTSRSTSDFSLEVKTKTTDSIVGASDGPSSQGALAKSRSHNDRDV